MDWPLGWSGMDVAETWTRSVADLLAWGLLAGMLFLVPLVVLFSRATRRRRFWCAQSGREVEVEIEERGFPGFRRQAAVKSCSVFDPATAVSCRRRCLDPGFPRQWPPALPVGRIEWPGDAPSRPGYISDERRR